MSEENPRWRLCRQALGREPKGYEFTIWNGGMWDRFLAHLKLKRIPGERASTTVFLALGYEAGQDAYDVWLKAEVDAGRATEMDHDERTKDL